MSHLPSLLIVDDIKENVILLKELVGNLNINLIQASSGFEALEKTKGIELALALIDVWMPKMNGYELAAKINEDRQENIVPIIFITANMMSEKELLKGYSSGAVDYIFKPINRTILLSKIQIFLTLFNNKQTILRYAAELKKSKDEETRTFSALQKSEQKYRKYIDNAPDGIFVINDKGKFIKVNIAACRITGYSNEELLNMSILDMLPEESIGERLFNLKKTVKTGVSKADLLFKHKDGSKRWWTIEAIKFSQNRFLVFTKDITNKKIAEEELKNSNEQLHHLAKHIEEVREAERVIISRNLHDDLGQSLTAVKIDLAIIKRQVKNADVVLKINNISSLVGETIKTVQRITSELRPQIIDDLGLITAIEWHTKEFSDRTGIEISLDLDSNISISPDTSLTLFRIMQESLTNIVRHSKASQVNIGLNTKNDFIYFRISDNGIGITKQQINAKNSFGIIGMKERAISLGGSFHICNGDENGTILKLLLPINNKLKNENSDL